MKLWTAAANAAAPDGPDDCAAALIWVSRVPTCWFMKVSRPGRWSVERLMSAVNEAASIWARLAAAAIPSFWMFFTAVVRSVSKSSVRLV